MLKTHKKGLLALSILIIVNLILLMPEAFQERIFPYDGALFAANGAFFLSVFKDINNVISSPIDWMWEYYHQYPALFIRRHPPLLGLVETVMFAVFGISAVTAKVTVLLFSIFWIIGWFFALHKMFKDELTAFFTGLLMLTLPMSVSLGTSVRADIPSMTFFAWGCYSFVCYLDSPRKKLVYVILTVILLSCALYTYQLPIFGIIAIFLYAITQWKSLYKRSNFYIGVLLFIILMLPLAVFTLKFASDNIGGVVGTVSGDFKEFIPVQSKWALENWTYYLKITSKNFLLPAIGLILWGITRIRIPIKKYEMFFLIWILLGYVGFSMIPSKGHRYAYHFVIAVLPLTVIGIRDSLKILTQKFVPGKKEVGLTTLLIIVLVFWNITGIARAKTDYVQDVDKAVQAILSEDRSSRILYHGAFESAFIFYTRKYDSGRLARVFRTTNELNDPETLVEDLSKHNINFIVIESENLRKNVYGGIYDEFYHKLNELVIEKDKFQNFGHFKTLFGKPNKEKVIYLKIYKVVL